MSVLYQAENLRKRNIHMSPEAALTAAGMPLLGIFRCFRVRGREDGSVPGGTSNILVTIHL